MTQAANQDAQEAQGTKTALITGAAHRLGAETAKTLHNAGYNIAIHYRSSKEAAVALVAQLNQERANSAACYQATLGDIQAVQQMAKQVQEDWPELQLLVNNASSFYPTELGNATEDQWSDLFDGNVKGAFFLSQALLPTLTTNKGSIVNIVDIYSQKPLKTYPIYSMAKSALAMMTQSLAIELSPDVRVNGVSPGAILWPEHEEDNQALQESLLKKIPLSRTGDPQDIANTVLFLAQSDYINGQIIAVDGGRSAVF